MGKGTRLSRGRVRVLVAFGLAGAMAAAGVVTNIVSASASVGSTAGFEDADANLAVNSTFDWNGFSPVGWSGISPMRTATKTASGWQFTGIEDWQASTSDTAFAGGTKQDQDCPSVITQKADNKADLKRIYLASQTIGGHTYLMLAWARIPQNTTSPSAHVAFEFNKGTSPCGAGSDGLVHRAAGDMLVVYDFEGGGSNVPTIGLSRWVTSGACQISSDPAPCWGPQATLDATEAEAAVDTGSGGLPSSALDNVAPSSETLGTNEFGEAGIDLTNAGVFTAGSCQTFGKAFGVSRTSGNSGTAQMKDLVGPATFSLTNCATVHIHKTSNGTALQGATFGLFNGANADTTGTPAYSCTTDANGDCTMSNLPTGTFTLDETSVPTGYVKAAGLPENITLGAGDNVTYNFDDPPAPGRINVFKSDDAGNALGGAVFTITGPSPSTATATCTTRGPGGSPTGANSDGTQPTVDGECSFIAITPGTYSIDETTVPTGYDKVSGLPNNSVVVGNGATVNLPSAGTSYVDPRQFKIIGLVCQQSSNTLYPSSVKIDSAAASDSESSAQLSTLVSNWASGQGVSLTAAQRAALENAICSGITTGALGGLHTGTHAANPINIP